jgi:hypothetical protein
MGTPGIELTLNQRTLILIIGAIVMLAIGIQAAITGQWVLLIPAAVGALVLATRLPVAAGAAPEDAARASPARWFAFLGYGLVTILIVLILATIVF